MFLSLRCYLWFCCLGDWWLLLDIIMSAQLLHPGRGAGQRKLSKSSDPGTPAKSEPATWLDCSTNVERECPSCIMLYAELVWDCLYHITSACVVILWNQNIWNKVSSNSWRFIIQGWIRYRMLVSSWLIRWLWLQTHVGLIVSILAWGFPIFSTLLLKQYTCHSPSGGDHHPGHASQRANGPLAASSPDSRIWNRTQCSLGPRGQSSCYLKCWKSSNEIARQVSMGNWSWKCITA